MKNNTVKLEDLELDTVYKDNSGHFFKFFYDESTDSPRNNECVTTILTWERHHLSPDENHDTLERFAEKHGVDVSKPWNLDDVITAMRKEGYYAVPVYALHHGNSRYSIRDFHDKWDSGVAGITFCKKQDEHPDDEYYRKIVDREIQKYDAWINGETYAIELLNGKEEVLSSSYGYSEIDGDTDEMLKSMLSDVGVDIQDEYQPAIREVSVSLK